jgi:hypothetical protein
MLVTMRSLALITCLAFAAFGHSAVIWNETIQGDLSGDRFNPNNLAISDGTNTLIGSTGFYDRDYFRFSLTPNQSITNIFVRDYVSLDDISFIAVQEGTIITEDPDNANVANLLGWSFFGTPEIGVDILPLMGSNWGSIGFTPPLTGSDYTFWLQQTGDATDYVLDFVVVPEPSTLIATGGLVGLFLKRRKAKSTA